MSLPAAGPEPDPAKPEPAKPEPGVSRKPLEDFLGRTVAIATIVGFIAQGFGAQLHTTAIVFVITFLAAYPIHRYLKRPSHLQGRLRAAPVSRPVLVAVGLACILGGMLFRQHVVISPAGVDVGELTDTLRWKMLWCRYLVRGEQNEACRAEAVAGIAAEVKPKENLPSERLFADQALGEVLRSSPEAMLPLQKYYGVDSTSFLGTGLSEPLDGETFVAERIPEYLVPNYPDSHEGVMVWKLDPMYEYADKKLYDVLTTTTPINAVGSDKAELEELRTKLGQRLFLDAKAPPVIRFALIPRGKYSGCLGRKAAQEVFASHLGLMKSEGLTVEEAARMSGYRLTAGVNLELYVFVFLPSHPQELREPTWTHMIEALGTEVGKPSPCAEASATTAAP
jgi:hypothetical protein